MSNFPPPPGDIPPPDYPPDFPDPYLDDFPGIDFPPPPLLPPDFPEEFDDIPPPPLLPDPIDDIPSSHGFNDEGDAVGNLFVPEDFPPPPFPGLPQAAGRPNLPTSGFLLSGGTLTLLNDPLAAPGTTEAWGVNDADQVVGFYSDANGNQHGFLYGNGSYSTLDYPGAFATVAQGINDAGQIVGAYADGVGTHGFLLSGGKFTSLDDPMAAPGNTQAEGINSAGQVVGFYYDAGGHAHGYLYSNGSYTTVDDPAAGATGNTFAQGINSSGQIVGYYVTSDGQQHGFLYSGGGTYITLDNPKAPPGNTEVFGINDGGQIIGDYFDSSGNPHGFVATPSLHFPFSSILDQTEALYVGYFGRAGDPVGVKFWTGALDSGLTIQSAAALFAPQAESQAQYPFLADPLTATPTQIGSFINSVYQDLFNRGPDSAGLGFWQGYLTSQLGDPQAVGAFILNVISGAQNTAAGQDITTIINKVIVSDFFVAKFTVAGITFDASQSLSNTLAHNQIASVTSDFATVTAAENAITAFIAAHPSGMTVAGISPVSHDLHM
jgi:probable HAF family extracellular repeat protein